MSDEREMIRVATVSEIGAEGLRVQFDGDEAAGEKYYTCNTSIRFAAGDRVLLLAISGTYIVFCKIGAPGGPVKKTAEMTQDVGVDEDGKLYAEGYTMPTASAEKLGGVKPVAKTTAMTQDVGVDSVGKLYTVPEKVKPVTKTTAMTQEVGMDNTTGKLYTAPPTTSEPEYARGLRYNSSARVTLDMDNNYNLVPSDDLTSYGAGLGTTSKYFQRAYIGSTTAKVGSKAASKIAFYGATPIIQQVLSTTSKNMSYTSATESNYLTVLNNIAGILKKLGLLT